MPSVHPIHGALYRAPLFLGVEQPVVALEATLVFALLVGVGLHLVTILLALGIIAVAHPVMATLTTHDPEISRVYLRSLSFQDYYPAHPLLTARGVPCRASIPGA